MEGYNEFDDYGMDSARGGKEFEQMIDSQVREIVEACQCEKAGTQEAADALLRGGCSLCGWNLCQIEELFSSLTCHNLATETLAINPSGWNGVEYAYYDEILVCADCHNSL